jgi:hypothetical protein
MANWYQDQLTNKNFLSPIGFLFILEKARKTSFLCQRAAIPDISLGSVDIPTRGMIPIPMEGNIVYGEFSMDFIVDEDLRNYMEIHNWIRALGVPDNVGERQAFVRANQKTPTQDPKYSDGTLQVLNNNNIANFDVVFKNMFPTSLSTVNFDVTGDDNDFLTATANFKYLLYEVRDKNRLTRR